MPDFHDQINESKMEQQGRLWHVLRHPGHCGLRATTCVLIVLSVCIGFPLISRKGSDPESVMSGAASVKNVHTLGPRRVRETANLSEPWMEDPSPAHLYTTNLWWRLMNHTVKNYGSQNCYVCAQFPLSAEVDNKVDRWPHQDHNTSTIMAVVAVAAAAFTENSTLSFRVDDEMKTIKVTKRVFGQVTTVRDIPTNLTCYSRVTGTKPLGEIPKSSCNVTYKENHTNLAARQRCLRCLNNAFVVPEGLTQPAIAIEYLSNHECTRTGCKASCAFVDVPDEQGTGVVENMYWQCGYAVYVSLPRGWTGTCALIQLHGGTVILPQQTRQSMRRKKRGLFNLVQASPVPKNHHIRRVVEKLVAFFVPEIDIASLMKEVRVTSYKLISFINTTKIMMESIDEEARELMLIALQNRLALDLLLAASSGVCAVVEQTCCTYVPENDKDGRAISEGMKNLTLMIDRQTNSGSFAWRWFQSIFTYVMMMMVICIVCSVLFFLCMALIRNAATSTFQQEIVEGLKPAGVPKPVNRGDLQSIQTTTPSCKDIPS